LIPTVFEFEGFKYVRWEGSFSYTKTDIKTRKTMNISREDFLKVWGSVPENERDKWIRWKIDNRTRRKIERGEL